MEPDRVEFFKKLLHERLEALLNQAGQNIGTLTDDREALSDTLDIATVESTRDFSLRLQDRERRLVSKVRSALQRIDDGEFGVCVSCGDEIGEKRLMARPVATHCIDCKTEAEQQERREF
jgi:DnaK suppressor protein